MAYFAAASQQPGALNSVSYTVLYTASVTLRCPAVSSSIIRPSWGRIVDGHKVGLSQCYDNTFNCTIIGGVVNEDGLHLLGHADSGLYFCRDFGSGEEYYLNLTVLGRCAEDCRSILLLAAAKGHEPETLMT